MSRSKNHRKTYGQIPSSFKELTKRKRRAKERQAVKVGKFEEIPIFKKSDAYDYF
jgi:hypothetical protein